LPVPFIQELQKEIYGEDIKRIQGAFPYDDSDGTFPERDLEGAARIDDEVGRYHWKKAPASDDGQFLFLKGLLDLFDLYGVFRFKPDVEPEILGEVINNYRRSDDSGEVDEIGLQGRKQKHAGYSKRSRWNKSQTNKGENDQVKAYYKSLVITYILSQETDIKKIPIHIIENQSYDD
jgi:hypothetical protein